MDKHKYFPVELRSKTVTETQGLPENQSLFADRQGKFSLFNEGNKKHYNYDDKSKIFLAFRGGQKNSEKPQIQAIGGIPKKKRGLCGCLEQND